MNNAANTSNHKPETLSRAMSKLGSKTLSAREWGVRKSVREELEAKGLIRVWKEGRKVLSKAVVRVRGFDPMSVTETETAQWPGNFEAHYLRALIMWARAKGYNKENHAIRCNTIAIKARMAMAAA